MADRIPDEVCQSAADMILAAAGSRLRHYVPVAQDHIIETTRNILQAVADHTEDGVREAVEALAKRVGETAVAAEFS